jgi:hypothetical protein
MSQVDAQEILKRYENEETIPKLDGTEQAAVRAYLSERAMESIFGSLSLSSESEDGENPSSITLTLNHGNDAKRFLAKPGAIVGPYFLGEEYYPQGVSIWAPRKAEA